MGWDNFWFRCKLTYSASFPQEVGDALSHFLAVTTYTLMGQPNIVQDVQMAEFLTNLEGWLDKNPRIDYTNTCQMLEIQAMMKAIKAELDAYYTERGGGAQSAQIILRRCYALEEDEIRAVTSNRDITMIEIGHHLRKTSPIVPSSSALESLRIAKEFGSLRGNLDLINLRFDLFEKMEASGLLRHDALFPRGGTHAQRREEIVQFAVQRREEWEASTKGMSPEEKKEAFWVYLKESGWTYDEALKAWRRARNCREKG